MTDYITTIQDNATCENNDRGLRKSVLTSISGAIPNM